MTIRKHPRILFSSIYEPQHDKTDKMASASSEDSDQPGHPHSLIGAKLFSLFEKTAGTDKTSFEPPHAKTNKMASASSEDSDQPGHPHSLIGASVVRTMDS